MDRRRVSAAVISGNELRRLFRTPLAFLFAAIFLLLTGYAGISAVLDTREATARYAVNSMAVLFLIAVPVLTMRSLSEDRSSGRLDVLFASSASTPAIVVGKFLGAAGFASLLVVAAVAVQLLPVLRLGEPDMGEILAGAVGLELFVAAAVAISLLWSALAGTVLVAGLGATMTLLVLWFVGNTSEGLPGIVGSLAERAAFAPRLEPFTFGLIRSDHVAYFAAVIVVSLAITTWVLGRYRPLRGWRSTATPVLAAGAAVLVAVVTAAQPARADLTDGRRLTLSEGTRQVLDALDAPVDVVAFLHPSQPDYREARNLLRLYDAHSGNLRLRIVNPAAAPQVAQRYGVQQPGEVILERSGRQQWASRATEDRISVALARLSRGSAGLICVALPQDAGAGGATGGGDYAPLRRLLADSGYDLAEAGASVPAGCDAVLAVGEGANAAGLTGEALAQAGARSLLVFTEQPLNGPLAGVLASAGLGVRPTVLEDLKGGMAGDATMLLTESRSQAGTSTLSAILPGAAPVQHAEETAVVARSANPAADIELGRRQERPEPQPVAAVGRRGDLRVGVVGDTDLFRNGFLRVADNAEFVLDMVARLSGREPGVRVPARRVGLATTSLYLSESTAQAARWYATGLVPASCLLLGLFVHLRRRGRAA